MIGQHVPDRGRHKRDGIGEIGHVVVFEDEKGLLVTRLIGLLCFIGRHLQISFISEIRHMLLHDVNDSILIRLISRSPSRVVGVSEKSYDAVPLKVVFERRVQFFSQAVRDVFLEGSGGA